MNTYNIAVKLMELFNDNPSLEDIIIEVMKIQGWTSKQARLRALYTVINKELKTQSISNVRDMLVNNYNYSRSGAYKLIKKSQQSTNLD